MQRAKTELLDFHNLKGAYMWSDSTGTTNESVIAPVQTIHLLNGAFDKHLPLYWVDCVPVSNPRRCSRFLFDYRFKRVIKIPIKSVKGWGRVPSITLDKLLTKLDTSWSISSLCLSNYVTEPIELPLTKEHIKYLSRVVVPKYINLKDLRKYVEHTFTGNTYSAVCIAGMWFIGKTVETARAYLTKQQIHEINREMITAKLLE